MNESIDELPRGKIVEEKCSQCGQEFGHSPACDYAYRQSSNKNSGGDGCLMSLLLLPFIAIAMLFKGATRR